MLKCGYEDMTFANKSLGKVTYFDLFMYIVYLKQLGCPGDSNLFLKVVILN